MLASIFAIFWYAPVEKTMGLVQKIFYIHVPSAFLAFFSFFLTFLASILYLYKKSAKWDSLAYCSAEIGVIFCTIVLITGPIWAKPIWNVWWTWDPRLTFALILWMIYSGCLVVRAGLEDPHRRARVGAVLAIVGMLDIPMVFMATRWFRGVHPASPEMEPAIPFERRRYAACKGRGRSA